MIDFARSYASKFSLVRMSRASWKETRHVNGVVSATITRGGNSLIESGSVSIDLPRDERFESGYYKLVMTATQGRETGRFDVCVLHYGRSDGNVIGGTAEVKLAGESVLAPAYYARMPIGSYVEMGADCVAYCATVLGRIIDAPVVAEGSFRLMKDYVFDINARVVDAVRAVLSIGHHRLTIDGDGTVRIRGEAKVPSMRLYGENTRMLMPDVSYGRDTSKVPNCYVAVYGGRLYEAVNDSDSSDVSVRSVGYRRLPDGGIDLEPTLLEGETIEGYCRRRLSEMSTVAESLSYKREYADGVVPTDLVMATSEAVGHDGPMVITTQSLEIGNGILVTERADVTEQLWQ